MATKPTKRVVILGRPPFVPSAQQRVFVAAMAGMRMTWDEITSTIINPNTNKPISKETLQKAFEYELAVGKQRLKSVIVTKYMEKLAAGDWNAISFGLRHICGFRDDAPASAVEDGRQTTEIRVSFVRPGAVGHHTGAEKRE